MNPCPPAPKMPPAKMHGIEKSACKSETVNCLPCLPTSQASRMTPKENDYSNAHLNRLVYMESYTSEHLTFSFTSLHRSLQIVPAWYEPG